MQSKLKDVSAIVGLESAEVLYHHTAFILAITRSVGTTASADVPFGWLVGFFGLQLPECSMNFPGRILGVPAHRPTRIVCAPGFLRNHISLGDAFQRAGRQCFPGNIAPGLWGCLNENSQNTIL